MRLALLSDNLSRGDRETRVTKTKLWGKHWFSLQCYWSENTSY